MIAAVREDIRAATFDCYGTLIDWEGGLGSFLYEILLREGGGPLEPGRALRERWEQIQFELVQGEYRPYKEILGESLRRWAAERSLALSEGDADALVRSMRSWQPFPDTRPALARAREAGLRLVIVSNIDEDIVEHTLRQLEVPFDGVVTAEQCRAYKPSEEPFQKALERIGESPARVLHVAFGFKYDIGPATRLGLRTAWVNRHAEEAPAGERPDLVWRDLWGLAELVGAAP
jgi:2-haloalkanoic acid dehalogenase type II